MSQPEPANPRRLAYAVKSLYKRKTWLQLIDATDRGRFVQILHTLEAELRREDARAPIILYCFIAMGHKWFFNMIDGEIDKLYEPGPEFKEFHEEFIKFLKQ